MRQLQISLWIDFKLYFYVRIHKIDNQGFKEIDVVNWFQIVFLREDSQVKNFRNHDYPSCELISNCIFTWGFTRKLMRFLWVGTLWIDFKLYFYVRIHKISKSESEIVLVVNWFQIVFLREDSQADPSLDNDQQGCELISNCIFTWGFTRVSDGSILPK